MQREGSQQEEQIPSGLERINIVGHWEEQEELPVLYANHILVRFQNGQFLLNFGRGDIPFDTGLSRESIERLRQEGVAIKTVARLAIAPWKVGEMVAAINSIYEHFRERFEALQSPPPVEG